MSTTVVCDFCHIKCEPLCPDTMPSQADGLSALATVNGIQCFYGSKYDGNLYAFEHINANMNTDPSVTARNICDQCIKSLLKQKEITLVSSDNLMEYKI
jgi:hypothetical protein